MKNAFKWFDEKLIDILNHKLNNRFLDKFMLLFTNFGGGIFTTCFTLVLILLGNGKARFIGLQIGITLIISQTITYSLKALLGRERPYNILKNLNTFDIILKDHSFPSGHTSASFAIATAIAFNMPQIAIIVYLIALIIGISRIYLGVHYPTDVAGGIIVGIGSAAIVHWGFSFLHFQMLV
jgi:undecaprenyl-diphosphatase